MILSPPEECKVAPAGGEAAAQENGTGAARSAFSSTAFREPILRLIASGAASRVGNGSTKAFSVTAFREPILRMLAERLSER